MIWPRQTKPPPSDWRLWSIAIHEVWILSETNRLLTPLGHWLHATHQTYKFMYNSQQDRIFERMTNGSIQQYNRIPSTTRYAQHYEIAKKVTTIPLHSIPIHTTLHSEFVIDGELQINTIENKFPTTPMIWDNYLHQLPQGVQYLLQFAHISDEGVHIASAIRNRIAIAVTDTSVEQRTNTTAISWIISDKNKSFHDRGDSGCPKFHNALDSYGSESFGLLVVLEFYRIRSGQITIACDNDSSLDKCIRTKYRAKPTDSYFDLLWTAFDIRSDLRIRTIPKRVTGHQDGRKKKLGLFEQLNVLCDHQSKKFRTKLESGEVIHQPTSFGLEKWHATLGNI